MFLETGADVGGEDEAGGKGERAPEPAPVPWPNPGVMRSRALEGTFKVVLARPRALPVSGSSPIFE